MLIDRIRELDEALVVAGGHAARVVRVVVTRNAWLSMAWEIEKSGVVMLPADRARIGDGVIRLQRMEGVLDVVQHEAGAGRCSLDKLEACPFCGCQDVECEAVDPYPYNYVQYAVRCRMCRMGAGGFASKAQATVAWNQRR